MEKIIYKAFEEGNIDNLKDLCDDLMRFQADSAVIRKDVMASMNFENRLLPDFKNTKRKYMTVAYDGDIPVGFAFVTVTDLSKEEMDIKPSWASDLGGVGFYPMDYQVPKTIGTFKLLYVNDAYRGMNIGWDLSVRVMTWLRSQKDVEDLWVFVANGNEKVGGLYEKLGFKFSHAVFNGFIEAYSLKI